MKKIFRIGAVVVAAALMFGFLSCQGFYAKKEGDDLLDMIEYKGTLGGKGTKADPYIVKGPYSVKMPEPIDKGKYEVCVHNNDHGMSNYEKTEWNLVAKPLLADYTFETTWRVVTQEGNITNSNDDEWPSKTFYFKVHHITNEKQKFYEFTDDGKKLVCIESDTSEEYGIKLTFDVEPEADGEDSDGQPVHYCTFTLSSFENRSKKYDDDSGEGKWTEWVKADYETEIPAILKTPRKFSYSTGYESSGDDVFNPSYDVNKFKFDDEYVWDDSKTLAENMLFCSYSWDRDGNYNNCYLYFSDDMFVVVKDRKALYRGKFDSDKTTFTGKDMEDVKETAPSSFNGKLGTGETGEKTLEVKIDGKSYTGRIYERSISSFVSFLLEW